MLADVQNSFTVIYFEKYATKPVPYFPPDLKMCHCTTLQNIKDRNWPNFAAFDTITLA